MSRKQEDFDISINKYNEDKTSIYCKHDFLRGEVIIRTDGNKLIFKKPSMDYVGKSHVVSVNKKTSDNFQYRIALTADDLPTGQFKFDEDESDEDCKVVFLPAVLTSRTL